MSQAELSAAIPLRPGKANTGRHDLSLGQRAERRHARTEFADAWRERARRPQELTRPFAGAIGWPDATESRATEGRGAFGAERRVD